MNANAHINVDSHHRDPDHTIDRALSALRDAAPRPGLEGRVLSSLDHRATVLGGPSFHGLIVKGWSIARGSARENARRSARLALWTATSAALLAIVSLLILHHHPTTRAHPTTNAVILSEASRSDAQSKDPDSVSHTTNPIPFSTTNLARITQTVSSRPERAAQSGETSVFENCSNHHYQGCPIHDAGAAVGMGGVSTTPTDAQALADLHAPSHPAPPLPLTPQEKLFLRMLRYGNATELAELDPLVRAQQDADETTAFKAFFPDPPPIKQPGDTE